MSLISTNKKKKFLPLLIFSFFFMIYLASGGGHGDSYDGLSYFLVTENLALHGSPSISIHSPSANDLGFDTANYVKVKASLVAYTIWEREWSDKYHNISFDEYKKDHPFGEFRDAYLPKIDEDHFFGVSYLVLPVVATPLYLVAQFFNFSEIHFVFLMLNSIIIATECVIIFFLSKEIFASEKISFVLSLIFGVTSYMWPYITTMFANPLGVLFLILSIYIIIKNRKKQSILLSIFAGLSIGLGVLSHLQMLFLLIPMIIYGIYEFRKNKKHVVTYLIGITIPMVILAYVNDIVNGNFTSFGFVYDPSIYGSTFPDNVYSLKIFEGVYGFLFSPGLSLFLYFPVSLLSPIGFYYLYKENKSLTILFISIILIIYLNIAADPYWNDNPYWGPHRYLLPLIPFITISMGGLISKFSHIKKWKWSIISLSIIGFFVNLLGNLVWPVYAFAYGWGPEGLWKIQNKMAVFTWDPYHSLVVQSIKTLASDWVSTLPSHEQAMGYLKVGLNGCRYDVFLFCQYGILPIILIGLVIIVLAIYIVKILNNNELNIKI